MGGQRGSFSAAFIQSKCPISGDGKIFRQMIYQRSVFYGVKADFRFFTAKHSLGLLRF